jgi:Effector Associated Constant Component 1
MDAEILLDSDRSLDDLAALAEWLRSERTLQGRVQTVQRAPREGELGGGLELLSVALGSGGVVTAFISSLGTWMTSRRTAVTVTLKVGDTCVTFDALKGKSLKEVTALVASALEAPRGD